MQYDFFLTKNLPVVVLIGNVLIVKARSQSSEAIFVRLRPLSLIRVSCIFLELVLIRRSNLSDSHPLVWNIYNSCC